MLYAATNTQFIKMLTNLSALFDKAAQHAAAKKYDSELLLGCRLAPDQFPLSRQIQIACDTAKLGNSRLTGKPAPSHADTEKTIAELRVRIGETIAYLHSLTADDYADAETRVISVPRWEGKVLSGREYALQHMIPNFYFHVATAYSILRHNGVDVGKQDYLGPLPLRAP